MAYTKNDWACGDKITADKLNRMEQGIEDAQNGYECEGTVTLLTEETVTTTSEGGANSGQLTYSQMITADKLRVTFNGTVYECDVLTVGESYLYGGAGENELDFSKYPFALESEQPPESISPHTLIYTQTAGTYTVKIEVLDEVVTTTPCFEKAVKSVAGDIYVTESYDSSNSKYVLDKTAQEITDALEAGRRVWIVSDDNSRYSLIDDWQPYTEDVEMPIFRCSTPYSRTKSQQVDNNYRATSLSAYPYRPSDTE